MKLRERELAPILVTVYNRYDHLVKCINALRTCEEANNTILYVASDEGVSYEDKISVEKIRKFLNKLTGFKQVILIERSHNIGSYANATLALKEVFSKHDCVVRLEDDVIVSRDFLHYMNWGLNEYETNNNVIGICANIPSYIPEQKNIFSLKRRSPYGVGMWKEKEEKIRKNFNKVYVKSAFENYSFFLRYKKRSPQSIRSIPAIIHNGDLPSDILSSVVMEREHLFAVYPNCTLSINSGNDGSGERAAFNKSFARNNDVISFSNLNLSNVGQLQYNKKVELEIYKKRCMFLCELQNYIIYCFFIRLSFLFPVYNFLRKIKKGGFKWLN